MTEQTPDDQADNATVAEPTNQVECVDCTTPYPPDLLQCPNCGMENLWRDDHLAGVARGVTETERAQLVGEQVKATHADGGIARQAENNTPDVEPRTTISQARHSAEDDESGEE